MNPDWQQFLTAQGAHIQDGIVQHFNDDAAERIASRDGTVLCALSQFGILKVSGGDAQGFLHNLFSSDVNALTPQRALLSSFNSAKGRMLAALFIWRNDDEFFLHLPLGLVAALQKKLSLYVLRAKVKIEDASNAMVCLGLCGADAAGVLQATFPALPQHPLDVVRHNAASLIRLDKTRFQINAPAQHAMTLWQQLAAATRPVGSPCWDWLNIRAGIPVILPQTQEQFVAQTVNFDLIGGINFKKGCYPGQEIVARMHYLGKPKRRMYLAHLAGEHTPQAGDELFSAEMNGQACGMIVNAAASPAGGHDILASIQISSHDTQTIHWQSPSGAVLQFVNLPYPLESA
ncbi:MAG: YgfZ/GcvT domain-containing protein [Pseudomonadota bacterium]